MQNARNKYVITKNQKIVNCGLYDSFDEAIEAIKDSIFRDDVEQFTVVTFGQYVDEVKF